MRNLLVTLALTTLRAVVRVLSLVVPTSRSVVVSAYPETEGNGVEVARALVDRYAGRVVWLRDAGPVPAEVRALERRGLVLVPKASVRGLREYLRAEAVLFTHGLYGSPRLRKPVVNLWHGDGPKGIEPSKDAGRLIASTYFVGSTSLFSHHQAATFGVPADRVLLTGNPRTDQLWRGAAPERLAELGITTDFVVWMPTFRTARAVGAMRAGGPVTPDRTGLAELAAGLRAQGRQLVVKPHPMDADRRDWPGAVTVDEARLAAAEVSLYELLGASSGLVTDYSSVWVDYLLLDRPIAFLVPDRDTYDRALYPADVLDWAPGEVVDLDHEPFARFLSDADPERRREVAARIGLNPTATSADDLVTALVKLGVLGSA
jgi:hypothetical protein